MVRKAKRREANPLWTCSGLPSRTVRMQAFFLGTSEPTPLAQGALPHTVIVVLSWASIFLGVSLTCFGLVNEARSLLHARKSSTT